MGKELNVIYKAKELSKTIFEITEKSPKKYRFSIIARMQNLSLEIISNMYRANDTYINMKLLSDIDKTIDFTIRQQRFTSEAERLFYKNKIFLLKLKKAEKKAAIMEERMNYSYRAMASLKEIDWLITLAAEVQCITKKQQERLAQILCEERRLVGGFIKSDRQRYQN